MLYGSIYGFPVRGERVKVKFDLLLKYMALHNCKCNRCGIYFKREYLKRDPVNCVFKICKVGCTRKGYRTLQPVPGCIDSLSRIEKILSRTVRIFCRGNRPQWRAYNWIFGRPNLSLDFNVWEDLSGLLPFYNDYNSFVRHSTENVALALV